jgi:hypothetical protein
MRHLRNPLLLALTFLVTFAMAAPTASADEVELSNESTEEHCTVFLENCTALIHGEAPTFFVRHFNGIEQPIGGCNDEFEALFHENGGFYIGHQEFHGTSCFKRNCDATAPEAGNGVHWPIYNHEEDGNLILHIRFCFESDAAPGVDQFCSVEVPLVETETHHYEFGAGDLPCYEIVGGATTELTGHWVTEESETHEDFVIEHIED